jgi:DICT domain-containing protein
VKLPWRVLSAVLNGFASKDKHRTVISSIVIGPRGWFATNTHRMVWSGEMPPPTESHVTDPRSVKVEIARSQAYGEDCDLTSLTALPGTPPNIERVVPKDLYGIWDFIPEQMLEVAKLAHTLGASRVTMCLRPELARQTEDKYEGGRTAGFVIKPGDDEHAPVYCLVMSRTPDGIRPALRLDVEGLAPTVPTTGADERREAA